MGRPRKLAALGLWMNGTAVGQWRVTSRGEHELHYDADWVDSPLGRPVSLSMPLRPAAVPYRGEVVRNFFENLLPENRNIRDRIAHRFRTTTDAFDLLREVGRDCAGALQFLPEGEAPAPTLPVDAVPLTEQDVAHHLDALPRGEAFGDDGDNALRLSLAGVQEKTALLWHQGRWCRPRGSTPTTHILKLPLGQVPGGIDLRTSVENEWLCMQLLRAYGVPAAQVAILRFGEHQVLGVERFDRRWSPQAGWLRLPQEDFAQVFGVDPDDKYEDKGGPGIRDILQQLAGSSQSDADRRDFFRTQVLFWMLAAIDGHAKNFGVFIEPRGLFRLAPRYDVLSAHPMLGTGAGQLSPHKLRMAMAVWRNNRHYRWAEIRRAHFEFTAADCRLRDAASLIDELVARTPAAIDEVGGSLPKRFPSSVAGPILDGLAAAARVLAQAAKAPT